VTAPTLLDGGLDVAIGSCVDDARFAAANRGGLADRVVTIFHIIIDPVTKKEATDLPRQAIVIGGPRLQQEPNESHEAFRTRVMAVANQLRKQNEQIA